MSTTNKNFKLKNLIEGESRCSYCRILLTSDITHVDHILPKSKGGTSNVKNLILSCNRCNLFKHDLTVHEFKQKVESKTLALINELKYYNFILENI